MTNEDVLGLRELLDFVKTSVLFPPGEENEDTEVKAEDCARKYKAVTFTSLLKRDSTHWLRVIYAVEGGQMSAEVREERVKVPSLRT